MSPRDLSLHCTVLRFPLCLRKFECTREATPFGGTVSLSCVFFLSLAPVSRRAPPMSEAESGVPTRRCSFSSLL